MILKQVTDIGLIKSVMTDTEMWEKIKTDSVDRVNFIPKMGRDTLVLGAFVDNVIGLHIFMREKIGVIYHPMLLKKFRKDFGREFIAKGLEWFFNNTICENIYVEIPTEHKHNINLARHFNFKEDGIKENAALQNDKVLNLKRLRLDKGDL